MHFDQFFSRIQRQDGDVSGQPEIRLILPIHSLKFKSEERLEFQGLKVVLHPLDLILEDFVYFLKSNDVSNGSD